MDTLGLCRRLGKGRRIYVPWKVGAWTLAGQMKVLMVLVGSGCKGVHGGLLHMRAAA